MKIQNIQPSYSNIYFKSTSNRQQPIHRSSPVKEGLKTAGIWLSFGVALDFVCRKCVVFKNSPTKNSLLVNSVLALIAGSCAALKAHNSHDFSN